MFNFFSWFLMQSFTDISEKWLNRRISSSVFSVFPFDRFCFHLRNSSNSDNFFVFFRSFFKNFSRRLKKKVYVNFFFHNFNKNSFGFVSFLKKKIYISNSLWEFFLENLPVEFEKIFAIVVFLRFFLLTYQL